MNAGKSVLVEKPFATTVVEARTLVENARSRGLLLMAGHTFLFSPPVRVVRDLIERGEIGEPLYVHSSRVNLGIHRSDVSVIWDLAPHDLSIMINWLGERPSRVSARRRTVPDAAGAASTSSTLATTDSISATPPTRTAAP